jgi:methylated-DNA-[protein]-cysteine S-methyltransferase
MTVQITGPLAVAPVLYRSVQSPLGELILSGDGERLSGLHMQDGPRAITIQSGWQRSDEAFAEPIEQLVAYFERRRTTFDLEVALTGTPFQLSVWSELAEIPYGETTSYGELARRIGSPAGVRAVGLANGRNPVSVIVPCHRVVGADGSLTGYGGGLENKRLLLDLEAQVAGSQLKLLSS